jgi:hypothetical protein
LSFASGAVGGDAPEIVVYGGFLVVVPVVFLCGLVFVIGAAVDALGRRRYPAVPIAVSWDVTLGGDTHVVSLPSTRELAPFAWVDGARVPLAWVTYGSDTSRADLVVGYSSGTITMRPDGGAMVAAVVEIAITSILGSPTASASGTDDLYLLEVEGAQVAAMRISWDRRLPLKPKRSR